MKIVKFCAALAVAATVWTGAAVAQSYPSPVGAAGVKVTYVRLGPTTEGFLLEPETAGPRPDIALVFSHPNRDNYNERPGWYMAQRGYRVMLVNYRGDRDSTNPLPENFLPSISDGISYLRELDGVKKVVLLTHSGGGHLGALYQNVAENGVAACNGPEKILPCSRDDIGQLDPADAVVFLDPTLGAAHQMTAMDPAVRADASRDPALDMFVEANGFMAGKSATYSDDFVNAFYAGQARRNNEVIDAALARLAKIDAGTGEFDNDEPFEVRGMGIRALGARLYQPDVRFQAHTKVPHLLLHADGTEEETIVHSLREPLATHLKDLKMLGAMNSVPTVREFLATSAVRANADYAMTEDDIVGVDWASSYDSTPSNATGIHVPTLVMSMSCHYLVVPAEIIYDRLPATDKEYVSALGATHGFTPCKPEYGDTPTRIFDFVSNWVAKAGRL
jgi:pimeloyl-ACP methyl ester carboxylesterase